MSLAEERTNRRVALVIATLGAFLTPFMGSSITVALPIMAEEFAMDAVQISWVATAYLLAAAVFLVPVGKLADIYGRKRVFAIGIGLYGLSSLLISFAWSGHSLIGFRVLQGLGAAMIFGTGIAILSSIFPADQRGKVLGINVAAVYLGLSVGPFLGGLMTEHLGWRSLFILNFFVGLILVVLTLWKIRGEWAEARGERFDWVGSILYGLMLVAMMYGFSLLPDMKGLYLILLGVIFGAAFAVWEIRIDYPVLRLELFVRNRVFAMSNLAALINYSATFAVMFLLSHYLQYIYGMKSDWAGIVMTAQPIVMAICSPFAGKLSDRIESRIIASIGMALTALGLLMLGLLDYDSGMPYILASQFVLGVGFALFSSPNANAIMGSVERRLYGIASATLGTTRLVGQMMSMGFAMLIFALFIGKVQITSEYFDQLLAAIKTAFTLFSFLCFCGVFASMARGNVR